MAAPFRMWCKPGLLRCARMRGQRTGSRKTTKTVLTAFDLHIKKPPLGFGYL
jgi:hypothetical protein